jgi:methylmalonyl-CoA mutase
MIRNTTQALAAIIGGCTSIDIQPHVDENNDYKGAEAIARNISNIIKEESYLDKVSNPGAGSYFIESLSFQMADAIWNLFQETEKSGGLINALKGNLIQDQIIESREKQWENLQNECTTMVGVNKYKIENNQHKKFAEIENSNNDFRILREYRLSDPFEIIKSEKGGNDEA